MSLNVFQRLFAAADAKIIELPAEVSRARHAYDRLAAVRVTDDVSHYTILDRLVAETAEAAHNDTPLPDCAAVEDARRAEAVAADTGEVLRAATETLASRVRGSIDPAEIMNELQKRHGVVVSELATAVTLTAGRSASALLLADPKIRKAAASIDGLVEEYGAIRGARGDLAVLCQYEAHEDVDGEFAELENADELRPMPRHQNFGIGSPPWPTTSVRARLEWMITHNGALWMPTPNAQDARWRHVHAADIAEVEQMRALSPSLG